MKRGGVSSTASLEPVSSTKEGPDAMTIQNRIMPTSQEAVNLRLSASFKTLTTRAESVSFRSCRRGLQRTRLSLKPRRI